MVEFRGEKWVLELSGLGGWNLKPEFIVSIADDETIVAVDGWS